MSHPPSIFVRGLSGVATAALALTGVVLLGPVSASAATEVNVSGTDIRPSEAKYRGWHEGFSNQKRAFSVDADGLHLGGTVKSQIVNGLIEHGDEGLDATNLGTIVEAASVDVVEGDVFFQLPVTWAGGGSTEWSTLRTLVAEDGDLTANDWTSSKPVGDIAAHATVGFDSLLAELLEQGNARYSAFGVLAEPAAPGVVKSITWNGTTYNFAPDAVTVPTTVEAISGYDIVGNDKSYLGWHEGFKNTGRSYSVDADGLHFGTSAHSQMLKGFVNTGAQGLATTNLGKLITTSMIQVTEGDVHVQVPVTWAGGWATLRSNTPSGVGELTPTLTDKWTTSKDIPATETTAKIVAHEVVALGDLLDALHAQSNVRYSGFGMLAESTATVAGVVFNGVGTVFEPFSAVAPTETETVSGYDIIGNEASYKGWHEGYKNNTRAYSVESDGLHLGVGDDSQILNGLVESGQPGLETNAVALGKLVASAKVEVASGDIHMQLPVTFGDANTFATIRSQTPETGSVTYDLDSKWTTSKLIPATDKSVAIAAHTVKPLGDILDALAANGNVRLLGYGILVDAGSGPEAVVTSVNWGDTKTVFSPFEAEAATETETVTGYDIAPNAAEYDVWHEGYDNAARAYKVESDGLHLGIGASSQILKGLVESGQPGLETNAVALGKLVASAKVEVASGDIHMQLPVTFGDANTFATIRSQTPETGSVTYDLDSKWTTSKLIPATDKSVAIAAHTVKPLGDILDALAANGNVRLLGYGILVDADSSPAAVVESISWGDTTTEFKPFVAPGVENNHDVTVHEIAPNESEYLGWHEGYDNAARAYKIESDGLHLGIGEGSQILNGLVNTGEAGTSVSAADLGKLLQGASVSVTDGEVWFQLAVTFGDSWATIRPAAAGTGDVKFALSDQWVSTRSIGEFNAGTLQQLLDALAAEGNVAYSGFGVLAIEPAVVENIVFNATQYNFVEYTAPAPTADPIVVAGDDVAAAAEPEDYFGWHEGYKPTEAGDHQVLGNGLNFATDGESSQILNGLVETGAAGIETSTGALGALIEGTSVTVAAGEVYLQIPVSWTDGGYATLRPTTPAAAGVASYSLNDQWVSSRPINGVTEGTLADLLDAVAAEGDFRYSGFGVLATDAAIVESITFDATVYNFVDSVAVEAGTVSIVGGDAKIGAELTVGLGNDTWGDAELSYQWNRDGVAIAGATGETYTPSAADYQSVLTVTVTGSKTGYTDASITSEGTDPVTKDEVESERLGGADRFAVSVAMSADFPAGVERVYIADGMGFADGLSAAPAAAHFDSPLLLTTPGALPAAVKAEIQRLNPAEIVVVGGTASVSANVLNQLTPLADTVRRIAGADRYAVSRAIAEDAFGVDKAQTAYLAAGATFPDALTAGPAAAQFDGPVILVNGKDNTVDALTKALLERLEVETIKIAGGAGSVSNGIEATLKSDYTVERFGGADRYAAAAAINEDAFDSSDTVFVASGTGFADALSGGALAAYADAPLYITPAHCMPVSLIESIERLGATEIVLLGGTASVSNNVRDMVACS